MKTSNGFTLIELLASIVIMSLLITAVLAPLTNLFRSTRISGQTLQSTTQAQNLLEFVKGQWKSYPRVIDDSLATTDANYRQDLNRDERAESRRRYDGTCYDPTGLTVPNGTSYSIIINVLDRSGSAGATTNLSTSVNCTSAVATAVPPLMKRITITVNGSNNQSTVLSANVARP